MDKHAAIRSEEADALFAPLRRYDIIVLAVSGGPDSLALLKLAHDWALRLGDSAPQLSVATVDHQLRKESADEARFVAAFCADLKRDHATLAWDDPKPWSGVLDAARAARYALLERHTTGLAGARSAAVVTGHTLNDQAETVFMRLKRGTGVDGLSAMAACRSLSKGSRIDLVRPLLGVPKTRLEGTLIVRGIAWCKDASNDDQVFERVRVRKAVENLKYAGLTMDALALTAARARQAREALDFATQGFLASLNVTTNGEIFAALDRAAFDRGPALLRQRVLAPLIARFGGETPRAELRELERLSERMAATAKSMHTLGGVTVSAGERTIRLWREAGRVPVKPLRLRPGDQALWDGRFTVAASRDCTQEVSVSALGAADYRALVTSGHRLPSCPARAAYALPAFRAAGLVLAVPQLNFACCTDAQTMAGCATRLTSVPAAET